MKFHSFKTVISLYLNTLINLLKPLKDETIFKLIAKKKRFNSYISDYCYLDCLISGHQQRNVNLQKGDPATVGQSPF